MRWIIGDIHGMLRPLAELLEQVHKRDRQPKLFFSGDYVNRGPESKGVIDLLLPLKNAKFIRGNHDDVFDLILHGTSYARHGAQVDSLVAFGWFMEHGLDTTLLSYGVDADELEETRRRPNPQRLQKVLQTVPESHRQFIRNLPAVLEQEDLFLLHAWWAVDESSERPSLAQRLAAKSEDRQAALWGRFRQEEIAGPKVWKRIGIFGHTATFNYPRKMGGTHPCRSSGRVSSCWIRAAR